MEKNIKYMLDQLDKQKTKRDKQLGLFNWIRSGVITFEEYQELVKYLVIPVVVGQSEQLVCKCGLPKDKKGGNFNCMRTDCDMPIAN